MHKLIKSVESEINAFLPDRFAIVFDGWSRADTCHLGFSATPSSVKLYGYIEALLEFSSTKIEKGLDSGEHYNFIQSVLEVPTISYNNVLAIVGDNTRTNKAFARRGGSIVVGCYSHPLNLPMKDVFRAYDTFIENIRDLMRRMSNQSPMAMLNQLTDMPAIMSSWTCWSSIYLMLQL